VSVPTEDTQATFAATLVDEWVRAGVTDAVICPGSRSTPLALALAARDDLRVHVRLDERGACFFAVGLGLATGNPVVVCTTSGTAAAELHAGVAEASHSEVPLIACTADRPARLHHVGAPQTIEQGALFGSAVRWSFDPGPIREADRSWWRSLGARSVSEAVGGAGPVHLNLAFDEPLVGTPGTLPPASRPIARTPGSGGPVPVSTGPSSRWHKRGMLIVGADAGPPELIVAVAERLGWPVLADPRSRARIVHPAVVAAADALLRDAAVREAATPEVVVLLGRPWASRVVAEFVEASARNGAEVVAVGTWLSDPARVVSEFHRVAAARFLNELASVSVDPEPGWRARFEAMEAAAQAAIAKALDHDALSEGGRTNEPRVARHLFGSLDAHTTLFVASSMPVRDLEWFAAPRPVPPLVLSNRGVNGIDGITSTAFGAAAGASPVVALLGDLAFFHDASALVSVAEEHGSCTLVVLDNGGGGIFNFLPQARALEHDRFEQLFGTRPSASVPEVARGFGLPVADVSTLDSLDDALERFVGRESRAVVRVQVPSREENVGLHDRIHAAVAEAVRAVLTG